MPPPTTPRVPHQTPMYEPAAQTPEDGRLVARGLRSLKMSRTWIIFFERLGRWLAITNEFTGQGDHVIGWDLQDTTVGTDVSDPVIPVKTGNILDCRIRVKVTDAVNDLEIDIRNNGVSIFATRPVLSAGFSSRVIQVFNDFASSPLVITAGDDPVMDVVQGGDWEVAVYLVYQEPT